MSDYIIIDGDYAFFQPSFGAAMVVVRPGNIAGSGISTITGKAICIDGDESSVEVAGCMYTAGAFSIPGTGTMKIQALDASQKAKKYKSGGTPVILKGGDYVAVFEVQSQAKQPPPGPGSPIPDPTPKYMGKGKFITTNVKHKGA